MLFVNRRHKLPLEEQQTDPLHVSPRAIEGFSKESPDGPNQLLWLGEAVEPLPQAQEQTPNVLVPSGGFSSFPGPFSLRTAGPVTDTLPKVTTQPADRQTGEYPTATRSLMASHPTTTSLRLPIVIPGSRKTRLQQPRPFSTGRRILFSLSLVGVCIGIMTLSALVAVSPVDHQGHSLGLRALFQPLMKMADTKNNNGGSLSIEQAQATAMAVRGYDPASAHPQSASPPPAPSSSSAASSSPVTSGTSTLNHFFSGQCTYWADYRYHQLTGVWVPWLGNAYEWYQQAINYGWHTSMSPNPNGPSIIVLGPYVQNDLSAYGHVGVVEHINGDGTVTTSNMHWPTAGVVSYVTFRYPVSGTHFIWA